MQNQAQSTLTDEWLLSLPGDEAERVIGPAYQAYLEPANFRPLPSTARLLTAEDEEALHRLSLACEEEEWESSTIEADHQPNFGCFENDQLVAVANYRMWSQTAAMPGVITHPQFRGRGYAKRVLSAATAHGLDNGFLMLYQTLQSNTPAIATAQSLGYQPYASHLAVRLRY
jgi:predicted GNAT family acetyltransferase